MQVINLLVILCKAVINTIHNATVISNLIMTTPLLSTFRIQRLPKAFFSLHQKFSILYFIKLIINFFFFKNIIILINTELNATKADNTFDKFYENMK